MGRAEPQLSPEMDLQICNFKMKLAVQMKPDLKWKHYDVPVAKFCNIRQSLRTNMEKREWCRRPRLLYNGTDVPLAWRGSALLSFGPSHEETERGLPDGAGREHIFGLSKSSQGNVRPYEMPPQSHDASYTGLAFLPSVSLIPSTVDILSSCS